MVGLLTAGPVAKQHLIANLRACTAAACTCLALFLAGLLLTVSLQAIIFSLLAFLVLWACCSWLL